MSERKPNIIIDGNGFYVRTVDDWENMMADGYAPVHYSESARVFFPKDNRYSRYHTYVEDFEENQLYWAGEESFLLFKLDGIIYEYDYYNEYGFDEEQFEKTLAEFVEKGELNLLEIFRVMAL